MHLVFTGYCPDATVKVHVSSLFAELLSLAALLCFHSFLSYKYKSRGEKPRSGALLFCETGPRKMSDAGHGEGGSRKVTGAKREWLTSLPTTHSVFFLCPTFNALIKRTCNESGFH